MTQKIYFLHLVFLFQTTLAFQLCVIIHDLYNDFSRRHLLVSRLFSNVPNKLSIQFPFVPPRIILTLMEGDGSYLSISGKIKF